MLAMCEVICYNYLVCLQSTKHKQDTDVCDIDVTLEYILSFKNNFYYNENSFYHTLFLKFLNNLMNAIKFQ